MARYAKQQKQTPSYKASTKGMNKSPEHGWKFASRKETFHRAIVDSNVEVTHRDKFKVRRAGATQFLHKHDRNSYPTALVVRSGKYIVAFVEVTSFASSFRFYLISLRQLVIGKRFITPGIAVQKSWESKPSHKTALIRSLNTYPEMRYISVSG